MQRFLLILTGILAGLILYGEDWHDYPELPVAPEPVNLVRNGGFENGGDGWQLGSGFAVDSYGRGGGNGLRYERRDPADYQVATQELTGLRPNIQYTLQGAVQIAPANAEASIYVEAYRKSDGKYDHGFYVSTKALADWNPLEIGFDTPADAGAYHWRVGMYLAREQTGSLLFDEISVTETRPEWSVAQLFPMLERIDTSAGELELASSVLGEFRYPQKSPPVWRVAAEVLADGRVEAEALAPVAAERLRLAFPGLVPGEKTLRVTLLDTANRYRVASAELPLRVRENSTAGVTIDEYGRTLVDGKPFLPLGLYLNYPMKSELARLKNSPFNVIMPYASVRMRPDGGGELAAANLNDICAVLDWWHEAGFKVIFSLKDLYPATVLAAPYLPWADCTDDNEAVTLLVQGLKGHPAILAWYICDEMSVRHKDRLLDRRRLVNSLDPEHPTWAVFMETNIIAPTRGGYDILGVDPYPIRSGSSDNMRTIVDFMVRSRERMRFHGDRLAMWTVPQIFGYQAYGRPEGRVPSADEMIAMTLLEAIFGAKGFVFYADMDIGKGGVGFDEHWARVLRLGEVMKELEPFLLSIEAEPEFKLEVLSGEVYARAFRDGERIRLLLTGVGPGTAKAIIRIDAELTSRHGSTRQAAPGVYEFTGENICFDILGN